MKRGFYIMFEGGEGAGTTTQSINLCRNLRKKNHRCIWTREPGGRKEENQIRKILKSPNNNLSSLEEFYLFNAQRTGNYEKNVIPYLKKGFNVIKDRGWPSTYAYQGQAGKIDFELIDFLTPISTQNITPDILFILDIDSKKGLEKETIKDRFSKKGEAYHNDVNQFYRDLAKKLDFAVLISYQEGNPQAMQEEIQRHLSKRLNI